MRFETLIFDLDGTISDPSEGILNCTNHALAMLGYESVNKAAVRPYIGPPLKDLLMALAGDVSEDTLSDLVGRYRERYATSGYAENRLYEGMTETLSVLFSRGYRLGVCTSKRIDFAVRILELFELTRLFTFVSGGDVGRAKEQQIAELVATEIDPASAVMIGDRAVDITAARAHGVATVGVLWGFGDRAEIEAASPDLTAVSPQDLLDLFT